MRCTECGAPGEPAITDAGRLILENVACLQHWPPGALTKLEWLQNWVDAERARLGPDPEPHDAEEGKGDDDE